MAELTDFETKTLWDLWLSAQIREGYFALLSRRYQVYQKWLTVGTLFFSSGALLTVLTTKIPAAYSVWLIPIFTTLTAIMSAVSLVARNERNAIDCQDLHKRWLTLANDYQKLWNNVYADDASEKLEALQEREAELSRSSAAMPQVTSLLVKVQDNVVMHHREVAA
jgi:hypothetical protein